MTAGEVFSKIAAKFTTTGRDKRQIQLKFETLRRNYGGEKKVAGKSGAGGRKVTPYDDLMDILWGKRKKFSVPRQYGQETSNVVDLENTTFVDDSNDEQGEAICLESVSDATTSDINTLDCSVTTTSPSKKKRKFELEEFKTVIKTQQQHSLNYFKQLQEESDDRADKRADKLLTGIQMTISALIAQKNQPTTPAVSQQPFQYTQNVPFTLSSTQTRAFNPSYYQYDCEQFNDNLFRAQRGSVGKAPVLTPMQPTETPPTTPPPPENESLWSVTSKTNDTDNDSKDETDLLIDFS